MARLIHLLMLAVAVAGCSDNVVEYKMTSEAIEHFEANAEKIAARDHYNSPIAISTLKGNQSSVPEGVKIWNPDPTLRSIGIKNADLITSIDGQKPTREYGSAFAANQKPFANATEQYVHFVSGLLALRESRDSLLLSIHAEYRTIAERRKHGGIHTKEPTYIRIVFP